MLQQRPANAGISNPHLHPTKVCHRQRVCDRVAPARQLLGRRGTAVAKLVALVFRQSAPDAEPLVVTHRMLQAFAHDDTLRTNRFGLPMTTYHRSPPLAVDREEGGGVFPAAASLQLPGPQGIRRNQRRPGAHGISKSESAACVSHGITIAWAGRGTRCRFRPRQALWSSSSLAGQMVAWGHRRADSLCRATRPIVRRGFRCPRR